MQRAAQRPNRSYPERPARSFSKFKLSPFRNAGGTDLRLWYLAIPADVKLHAGYYWHVSRSESGASAKIHVPYSAPKRC